MKLGGSVITDKTKYATPRPDTITRLARELASAPGPIIVVHGAGSFGHVIAREHDLATGDDGNPVRRQAFARVHADVRRLHAMVLDALQDAGRPAVGLSTFDLATLSGGALAAYDETRVALALDAGLTPVVHGDGALDVTQGYGILSGDVVMVQLARAFIPSEAIFVTDVDGIYDRAPSESGATLFDQILPSTQLGSAQANGPDVTGGMAGKLRRAREVAATGVPVRILNGAVPGRLADALAGKQVISTRVDA